MKKSLPEVRSKEPTPGTSGEKAKPAKVGAANSTHVKGSQKPGILTGTLRKCGEATQLIGKGKTEPQSSAKPPSMKRKYSEVAARHLWRALVAVNSGSTAFTETQQEQISGALHSAIKQNVMTQKVLVQIDGIDRREGRFIVKCANQRSSQWLESVAPNFQVSCGKLDCVKLEDLPRLIKCVCWIPHQHVTRDEVIPLVRAQNPSLNTEKWRLWSLVRNDKGQILTLGVDEDSLPSLEKIKYRPYLLDGRVDFRIAKKSQVLEDMENVKQI